MQKQYIAFYKPFQVLCQFSPEQGKETLADYLPGILKSIYPVGRLDSDSEGLLILTNDKQMTHQLLDPSFAHNRTYYAQVEGVPDEAALQRLRDGVRITVDGKPYTTRPAQVALIEQPLLPERNPPIRYRKDIPDSWIAITLTEGKNRQVRKMTAAAGHPTLRLVRHSIGSYQLGDLQPGKHLYFDERLKKKLFI